MRIQPIFYSPQIKRTNFKSTNRAEDDIRKQEDELHKEEWAVKNLT